MGLRVFAVADSESFLKWAATTLDRLAADCAGVDGRVVLISGPLEPSTSQVEAALADSPVRTCPVVTRRQLAAMVRTHRPDVILVAATGPVAEMVALTVLRAVGTRPTVLLSGPPGMAMAAASTKGVKWRSQWCDAYIVHSPREVELFHQAFMRRGSDPRIIVARLPFLKDRLDGAEAPVQRVVFAPQPILPRRREDRVTILDGLAQLHDEGFDVVVKLRARRGEQQSHLEAVPFDRLWQQEHSRLGYDSQILRFETGPMSEWLTSGTALVTVSSTAALESLSLGLRTVLIADFGIAPELANQIYADSGCMVRLSELSKTLRSGGPIANSDWLRTTYLHDWPSELGVAVGELVASHRDGTFVRANVARPVNRLIYLYSALKSSLPMLWYPAKWSRAILGRFVQIS